MRRSGRKCIESAVDSAFRLGAVVGPAGEDHSGEGQHHQGGQLSAPAAGDPVERAPQLTRVVVEETADRGLCGYDGDHHSGDLHC